MFFLILVPYEKGANHFPGASRVAGPVYYVPVRVQQSGPSSIEVECIPAVEALHHLGVFGHVKPRRSRIPPIHDE